MPQLVLSRGINSKRNVFKRILMNAENGPYFLVISLVLFVVLVTVITLTFSAQQVTKGYVLSQLEAEQRTLLTESERREKQVAEVRSLRHIEESSRLRAMRNPSQIVFLSGDTVIASN